MHKKKFFAKLVAASILTGGINFLPAVPIFNAGNLPVVSIAHAEIKNFSAKNTAMTDVESLTNAAKGTAKERAINLAQKKAETFFKTLSPTLRGRLTDEDITAVVINNFKLVAEPQYRKLYYQAVDEQGNDLGRNGEIYEATLTIQIDTAALDNYRKLGEQEREKLIKQAQNAQSAFEEIDRDFEELRNNARRKSPQQLQADIKKFEDKVSKAEKRRKKNQPARNKKSSAPANKPVAKETKPTPKENKPAVTENKPAPPVTNQPMQFSQPVKIGSVEDNGIVDGGYKFKGAVINTGTPYKWQNEINYKNGIAAFGKGEDLIYLHYNNKNIFDKNLKRHYGGKDFKNTFLLEAVYGCDFTQIKTNKDIILYLIHEYGFDIMGENYVLLGKKQDGTFVKYFDFKETIVNYFGEKNKFTCYPTYLSEKDKGIYFRNDSIIIKYSSGRNHKIAVGEFRFKWDEKAQWFSVEHIKY